MEEMRGKHGRDWPLKGGKEKGGIEHAAEEVVFGVPSLEEDVLKGPQGGRETERIPGHLGHGVTTWETLTVRGCIWGRKVFG